MILLYSLLAVADTTDQLLAEKLEQCLQDRQIENHTCVSKFVDPCFDKKENQNTQGIVSCYQQSERSWDILLNKYYQLLRKKLEPDLQQSVKETQLIWIDYKEKTCSFEYNLYIEGTMRGPIKAQCLLRETSDRAIDFYRMYRNY